MKSMKKLSLVMIMNECTKEVLLGLKKRGFGTGKWSGFGGKLKENETMEECARRETLEECSLRMEEYFKIGHMIFEFVGDPVLLDIHVFRCDRFSGQVTESEEMLPKWFSFHDVPFDKMWPDDVYWYPHLFAKQKFKARYLFEGHDIILKKDIECVKDL